METTQPNPITSDAAQLNTIEPEQPQVAKGLPSFGTLWGRSWSFVGANFWRLMLVSGVSVLLSMPPIVMSLYLQTLVDGGESRELVVYGLAGVSTVLFLAGSMLTLAVMSVTTVSGHSIAVKNVIHEVLRLLVPLSVVTFLVYAVIIAGFLFLIIPGLVLMILLLPAMWVVVAEGLTARAALERSMALVSGRLWSVAWRFSLVLFVVCLAFMVALMVVLMLFPLFFMLSMLDLLAVTVVGGALLFVGYTILSGLLGFFFLRFMYELYLGLVATVAPAARSWWQGRVLSVLLPIGMVFAALYILASPYLTVEDMKNVPIEEMEFSTWLEANPEEAARFDNPIQEDNF